jgi:hypothetical protein
MIFSRQRKIADLRCRGSSMTGMADRGYKECGGGSICESMVGGRVAAQKRNVEPVVFAEHGRRKEVATRVWAAAYVTW